MSPPGAHERKMDSAATDVKHAGRTLGENSPTNQPILRSIPSRLTRAAGRYGEGNTVGHSQLDRPPWRWAGRRVGVSGTRKSGSRLTPAPFRDCHECWVAGGSQAI